MHLHILLMIPFNKFIFFLTCFILNFKHITLLPLFRISSSLFSTINFLNLFNLLDFWHLFNFLDFLHLYNFLDFLYLFMILYLVLIFLLILFFLF